MKHKKKVKKALKHFDFEKVHDLMIDNNWKWFINSGMAVPSIKHIKYTAKQCLDRLETNLFSGTGGFVVFKYKDKYLLFFGVDNIDSQFDY